ncbi:aldo/keto reductase [Roseateles koreensis]|uniref:Aldo/keto reductase n=1 Tax=Roseateles koreensis TaxID=2987526 RepID=A0ABT5KRT4_9BURK|nr:aldo/keto reductase [Roseateles koreensis]MDC8785562.1 aldo/keto reductase [Roseateles koreensis]
MIAAEAWQLPQASQLALAWVLHKYPHVYVIPGTRRRTHLASNWGAASLVLAPQQVQALDDLFVPGRVQGARYTEGGWVGIESPRGVPVLADSKAPAASADSGLPSK